MSIAAPLERPLCNLHGIAGRLNEAIPPRERRDMGRRGRPRRALPRSTAAFEGGAGGAPQSGLAPATLVAVQPGRYILLGRGVVAVRARASATADVTTQLKVPAEIQVIEFGSDGWTLNGRRG